MAFGPGKYDDVCTAARNATGASGVVLIIIDGKHGNGFSCQATPLITLSLPDILDKVAADIRRDGPAAGQSRNRG